MEQAFPMDTAGTDGNLGLDDVIAGAEGIGLRIEKGVYPPALVRSHEMPDQRGEGHRACSQQGDQLPPQPRQEKHHDSGTEHQQCRAEVRLTSDQECRNDNQNNRPQDPRPGGRQWPLGEVPGKHHGNRDLEQLRGLEAHDPQVQPALGALTGVSHYQDTHQHRESHAE